MDTAAQFLERLASRASELLATLPPPPFDEVHIEMALTAAMSVFLCASLAVLHPSWVGMMDRSRNISTIHAIVVAGLVIACFREIQPLLFDESGAIWTYSSPSTRLPVSITVGYILFDTMLGFAVPGQLDFAMTVHHAVVLASYFSGIAQSLALPYQALFLINEASSPFLNWHFQFAGKRGGNIRTINGGLLWLAYLMCRIVANTYLTWSVVTTSSASVRAAFPLTWGIQIAVLATLTVLNANWFFRITRGFIRALTGGKAVANAVSEEELLKEHEQEAKTQAEQGAQPLVQQGGSPAEASTVSRSDSSGSSDEPGPASSASSRADDTTPVLSPGGRTGPTRQRRVSRRE